MPSAASFRKKAFWRYVSSILEVNVITMVLSNEQIEHFIGSELVAPMISSIPVI
jgi:hypothetical protein